jgi:hypothetical protein
LRFAFGVLLTGVHISRRITMSANYVEMISSVKSALKLGDKAETELQTMGLNVAEFFGSEKALEEVKAQFIADAIHSIVKPKHIQALAVDLPRMNSKAYKEACSADNSYPDKWDIANQAKKDARSTIETYYKRVVKFAFPAEKKESPKKGFIDRITKLIEDGGKIKECDFDLVKVMGFLIQAEKTAKIKI